jgi:hypothetical protein
VALDAAFWTAGRISGQKAIVFFKASVLPQPDLAQVSLDPLDLGGASNY